MSRDAASISDMLEFARNVLAFTAGFDEATFSADRLVQTAVLYQLTVIGEAVRRVSRPTRLAYPDVPWLQISNMRNILIHAYDDINLPRVWNVVTRDIPALIDVLEPIVRALDVQRPETEPE